MTAPLLPPTERPRRLSTALKVSLIVHACLLIALLVIPLRMWVANQGAGSRDLAASDSQAKGARSAARESPKESAPTPEAATRKEKILSEKVATELDAAIESARELPDDEKLTRLDQLGEKLNQVSSDKSLAELSQKFQGWLKTQERAVAPAEKPAEGDFDYGTAQFHDMVREELPEGGYRYKSVLLDGAGRTVEIEVDAAEGESTYNALTIVKRNPLLDKVYRSLTMPLLDKLIKAGERAADAELAPVPVPGEVDGPGHAEPSAQKK